MAALLEDSINLSPKPYPHGLNTMSHKGKYIKENKEIDSFQTNNHYFCTIIHADTKFLISWL